MAERFSTLFPNSWLLFAFLTACVVQSSAAQGAGPLDATSIGQADGENELTNFLFILVDDLGWADVGYQGSTFYETPHIDRLRSQSVSFPQGYAAAPICSPTRASILTGKYPVRLAATDWFGAPQPEDVPRHWTKKRKLLPAPYREEMPLEEVTLAETLQAAGYHTFFAGKWHLGEAEAVWPEHQGFAINLGGWGAGHPKSYYSPYHNPRLTDGTPGEHLTRRLARETADYLRSRKDEEAPFLAYLSFYSVHTPLQADDSLVSKYTAKRERLGLGDVFTPIGIDSNRTVRRVQAQPTFAAMVEIMDAAVGEVLAALEQSGLADNTVVIFTSDNGGLSTTGAHPTANTPLYAGKGWLYEGGIRVPLLIRWPGVTEAGSTSEVPVISTDFYPTMLAMAGLPAHPEQHVDGLNLVPLLRGAQVVGRALYWHYPHNGNQGSFPGSAIRRGDYKLIENFEAGTTELYDLRSDLGEEHDLAKNKAGITARLLEDLQRWREATGARYPTPNPNQHTDE